MADGWAVGHMPGSPQGPRLSPGACLGLVEVLLAPASMPVPLCLPTKWDLRGLHAQGDTKGIVHCARGAMGSSRSPGVGQHRAGLPLHSPCYPHWATSAVDTYTAGLPQPRWCQWDHRSEEDGSSQPAAHQADSAAALRLRGPQWGWGQHREALGSSQDPPDCPRGGQLLSSGCGWWSGLCPSPSPPGLPLPLLRKPCGPRPSC